MVLELEIEPAFEAQVLLVLFVTSHKFLLRELGQYFCIVTVVDVFCRMVTDALI